MTYLTGEVTVVHDWTKIDFTNFVYSGFRFNGTAAGATTTINGATVSKIVGVTIDSVINENTTTIDEDLILLGNPQPTFSSNIKGASTGEYQSKYSFYFVGDNDKHKFRWENGVVPNVSQITGSQTVSGYAKIDGDHLANKNGYIVENYFTNGGFALGYVEASDVWQWKIDTSTAGAKTVDSTTKPTDVAGIWVQVTGVWNAPDTTLKIFINGIKENETAGVTGFRSNSTQPLRIGAESPAGGEMKGEINNVVIWDEALTDEEVLTHFNNGNPYNVLVSAPKKENIVFWSKVGDDSQWDGTDWFIKDQISGTMGTSSFSTLDMTYTSRVKDAP